MAKSLFEQLGGTYHEDNGFLIPDLRLPDEEEQPIGLFGQRHLCYLKEYHRVTYINLLTSGRLNTYFVEIDKQAQERFERLIEQMKQSQGITEKLKSRNHIHLRVTHNKPKSEGKVKIPYPLYLYKLELCVFITAFKQAVCSCYFRIY